jgi:hypothetical protein
MRVVRRGGKVGERELGERTRMHGSVFRLGIAALLGGIVAATGQDSLARETPPSSHHSPAKTSAHVVHLSTNDVLGQPVRLGPGTKAPVTVVFFVNKKSQQQSEQLASQVDRGLSDRRVAEVTIVDAHKYGGMLKSEAMKRLKKAAENTRLQRQQRQQQQQKERHARASRKSPDRWYLVGDFDGSCFRAFGLPQDTPLPVAFVVARSGTVSGPYREASAVVAAAGHGKAGVRKARRAPGTGPAKAHP